MKKIILFLFMFLITGCYNYNEVEDLAIISAMSIDYKEDEFEIMIEHKINKKEDDDESIIYEAKGSSLDKAIQNVSFKVDKTLYFIDLNVILLTTDAINAKLDNIIDYITREQTFGFNFNILLCENPKEIIDILKKEKSVSNNVFGNYFKGLFNADFLSIINVKYGTFLETYLNGYANLILPYVTVQNNEVSIQNAYLFSNKKTIYLLNEKEIQIYNLLINEQKIYLFEINYNDKKLIYKVLKNKTKIDFKNDKLVIESKITGDFDEMDDINIEKKATIEKLRELVAEKIESDISDFIDICKNNETDPLALRKTIYNQTRKKQKSIKNVNYKIKTDIKIDREGLLYNSMGDEFEKNN